MIVQKIEDLIPNERDRHAAATALRSLGFTSARLSTLPDPIEITFLVPILELTDVDDLEASLALMRALPNVKPYVVADPGNVPALPFDLTI